MRPDMNKLLCLRPRVRSNDRYSDRPQKNKRSQISEDAPTREKMGRFFRGGGSKEFGEYLAPFERWLNKQVGRPWDKVYSELCAVASKDNAVQLHAHQHLRGWVALDKDVEMIDGKVFYRQYPRYSSGELSKDHLYVHPETKLLMRYRGPQESSKKEETRTVLPLDKENACLVQQKGIWYRVEYSRKPRRDDFNGTFGDPHTLAFGRSSKLIPKETLQPDGSFKWGWVENPNYLGVKKQQLNTRELQSYGLANAA